jgi:hypothetical protein
VLAASPYNQVRTYNQDLDGNVEATISVARLRKRFGATTALDGMSFTVRPAIL